MTQNLTPASAPLPSDLLTGEDVVTPAANVAFTEGPAVDKDGTVYFSDIQNNRIMKLSPDGDLSTFRSESGRANGNIFDAEGRLVTCEGAEFGPGGGRKLTRTNLATGEIQTLTDRFEGKRYNSPNDVCIDTQGNIYFTDPLYDDGKRERELEVEAIYCLDTEGEVRRVLSQPEIQKPNGIAITSDNKTLYVVDSNPKEGGNRKIWAFTLSAPGVVEEQRLVYDFAPGRGGDGMRIDQNGNLWIAAGLNVSTGTGYSASAPAGIYVVTAEGELLGRIPIPEDKVTNLTFGPPDCRTLYVTSGRNLYRIPIAVSGYVLWS